MKKVTGVVIAGGKSSRFGQDKALFAYRGQSLVEHAINIIKPHCGRLVINTNKPEAYTGLGFECINDVFPDAGPLGGIHSALSHAGGGKVVIIACDTPHIPTEIYGKLLEQIKNHDLAMPVHKGFIETMCAVYSSSCLQALEASICSKQYRILDAVKPLRAKFIDIDGEDFYQPHIFHNINFRKDVLD